jgi:hypothetical protein
MQKRLCIPRKFFDFIMEFVSLWLLQMFLSKSYVLQAEMSTAADDQPLPRRGRFQKKLPRCCRAAMG